MKISVVVPIYRVEAYLATCVNSILNQSYRNLEIILVDDGSPDKCPEMCDDFARSDSRVKVVHKANAGLGMARNTGIDHATGEYICFVDSDDYIAPNALEVAYETITSNKADVALFGMMRFNQKGDFFGATIPHTPKEIYEGAEVQEVLLPGILTNDPVTGKYMGIPCSAWSMLLSMQVVRRLKWRFVSEREYLSEDIYSLLVLYQGVRRASIISEALYFYRVNENSLTQTYKPERFVRCRLFYEQCMDLCTELNYSESVRHACTGPFMGSVISAMKHMVLHIEGIRACLSRIQNMLTDSMLQHVLSMIRHDKESIAVKLLIWAMRHKNCYLCYILVRLQCIKDQRLPIVKKEN